MAEHLLNKKNMAKSCGIGLTAFDKWEVKPVSRKGREAFYDVSSVIKNRVDNALEKVISADGEVNNEELLKERIRLTKAQADAQEIRNDVAREWLIPMDLLSFILPRIAGEISSRLDGIPLTLKRKYPELKPSHIEAVKTEVALASNRAAAMHEELDRWLEEYERATPEKFKV